MILFANLNAQEGWIWQNPLPQGNTLNDIHIFNENTAIAVGNFGTIIKTTDGGLTWDVKYGAGGVFNNLLDVTFSDINNGWAVGLANLWSADNAQTVN